MFLHLAMILLAGTSSDWVEGACNRFCLIVSTRFLFLSLQKYKNLNKKMYLTKKEKIIIILDESI